MKEDQKKIEQLLTNVVTHSTNFFNELDSRPVAIQYYQPSKDQLPELGIGANQTLDYFVQHYSNGLSASAGARYLGFITGGATPASIMGDWLASVYDQNVSSSQDSVAGTLETETLDMLKELLKLDTNYSGTFVSGATMSNFVGLAQARQWAAHHYGKDLTLEGLFAIPSIKLISGAPHSSIFKAASMLGMGRNSIHLIPCQENQEAININLLKEFLEQNKYEPCIVIANAGTVNTVDYDDLIAIGKLKKQYNFWLHIDAAFGGFAACSPLYDHLVAGINKADSITIDAHKWLNVPYDSAMQFTRHKSLQVEVFQNNAAYLGSSIDHPDFFDLTPENSRRFRALPAWFTLKAYGKEGYQTLIEENVTCAKNLEKKIINSEYFELLAPVNLNVVCFTLKQESVTAEMIKQFLATLNQQGDVFMTPTIYNGVSAIRAAFSNWRTESKDVEIIWKSLLHAVLLKKS
ncbi:amino acid decarboxylase [Enterococcus silesiacus]|nr:pyridoxal-dependent decarboxylase [Enterococcus silesiacus]OJG88609.1 amino acid decarboxylase [Enterococcus silesiacus]